MMIRGHALWLVPQEPVSVRLSALIDSLARRYGGPRFVPHVTLVSGIELPLGDIRARAHALAQGLPPAVVTLRRAACRDEYYKALFLEVEGADLRDTHARAAAALGVRRDPDYLPHLSVVYGDFGPLVKEAMLDRVGRRWGEHCTLDRLVVVSLEGPPESWAPLVTERLTLA
jgi:cyclic phosphodiesterase-like protein